MSLAPRSMLWAALLFAGAAFGGDAACGPWPEWQRFKQLYVSDEGRVIDAAMQGITVSEGQSYALTFAIIGNDPAAFRTILRWTENNLSAGDLTKTLPAWKWGKSTSGAWQVLDANSASDADLWVLYALNEASQLWHEPGYANTARGLANLILAEDVAQVPGLGATLLPGPKGFVSQSTWRLNASYAPLQIVREFGARNPNPLWAGVLESSRKVIDGSSPRGYAADWILFRPAQGFVSDEQTRGQGSYNAIRVYLWAGMLADGDPDAESLALRLKPMALDAASGALPEAIDTSTLARSGGAPAGFSAALLPLLTHFKMTEAAQRLRRLVEAAALKDDQHYYNDVLSLFALGWIQQRYQFDRQGRLRVPWSGPCRVR